MSGGEAEGIRVKDLLIQLFAGGVLIIAATVIQVCFIGSMMLATPRVSGWVRQITMLKIATVIALGGIWMIVGQLVGVWVWALSLAWLGAFPELEVSLYFSLSAYTTLGFGDVLPAVEWRILGALIGANGMLGFGLATAALVEFVLKLQAIAGE